MQILMSEGRREGDAAVNLMGGASRETIVESHVVYGDSDRDKDTCQGWPRQTTTAPKAEPYPDCERLIATTKSITGRFINFSNFRKHVKVCSRLFEPREA